MAVDILNAPITQSSLGPWHLLSIDDLGKEGIHAILDRAEELRTTSVDRSRFAGKILGLLFFQPSTRTRFGFHAAMVRLGGTAIELNEAKYQPGMIRPESLSDTVRCISAYCDAIVLRHPCVESFREALSASSVPVINGGSGAEDHPTQALIDLLAIRRSFGRVEDARIAFVGDLKGSRAALSLLRALRHFQPIEVRMIAPAAHQFPSHVVEELPAGTITTSETLDLGGVEIVYMAGFPAGTEDHEADEFRLRYSLRSGTLAGTDSVALVLSPLPRIDEIDMEVDDFPQAGYFQQSAGALFVRMAVIEKALNLETILRHRQG